jgi:hypothetical protein
MIGVRGRSNWACDHKILLNKTGALLVIGGVYALDLYRSNAATVDEDSAANNLVPIDATNVLGGRFLVATEAGAINANCKMTARGFEQVLVTGAVNPGDYLQPVAGSTALSKVSGSNLISAFAIGQANGSVGAGLTALASVDFFGSAQNRGGPA